MSQRLWLLNDNHIVMVDDNEADLMLVRICLGRSRLSNPWLGFTSGPDFLAYLDEVSRGEQPMPALVLLDINMPEMSGFEVLAQTRGRSEFDTLPVFCMLTSSSDPRDRSKALEVGASGFVTKPSSVAAFVAFLDGLQGA